MGVSEQETQFGGGLLGGIGPWHVRMLVDDAWNGGCGKSLAEVGNMTLDQVMFLLVDRKAMKNRTRKTEPTAVAAKADADGNIKGRDADGNPMIGRITGKSVARKLMEAAQKKRARQERRRKRRKKG